MTDLDPVPERDPGSTLPGHWPCGGVFEIFVRAWKDSNGDGIGDLPGVISTLPYLCSLGVSAIWLLPVHPSADNDHGYAVTDYRGVHPDYGTLADMDRLIAEAHALGIGVILDYVINHSSTRHPLFVQSSQGPGNPFRHWYVWENHHPPGWHLHGQDPWFEVNGSWCYGAFGHDMPDFNWRHPAVTAWHHDNLRFWLNRGIDGFRFDAVGHLVENGPQAWDNQPECYPIMAGIRQLLDGYQHRWMVCEAPNDPFGFARVAGSAFTFGLNRHLVAAAAGDASALSAVVEYWQTMPPGMAVMLANHDIFAGDRVHDQLRGSPPRQRLAAASLLLGPGVPFIYYGEEIGMAGDPAQAADVALRTPMSWTADGSGFSPARPFRPLSPNAGTHNVAALELASDSQLGFYRRLMALRRARPSIERGGIAAAFVDGQLLGFQRVWGDERTLVLLNYGDGGASVAPHRLPSGVRLLPLEPGGGTQPMAEGPTPWLPPHAVRVYAVEGGAAG